jgi:hypothetical protein
VLLLYVADGKGKELAEVLEVIEVNSEPPIAA